MHCVNISSGDERAGFILQYFFWLPVLNCTKLGYDIKLDACVLTLHDTGLVRRESRVSTQHGNLPGVYS